MKNEKLEAMATGIEQIENGLDTIITLKAVFNKSSKHAVQPAKDNSTGWYAGVPRLSEEERKKNSYNVDEKSKIILQDGYQFDLTTEVGQKNWQWVKHLKEVAMSFEDAQKSPQAMFYVYLPGREARDANVSDNLIFKAMKYIMEDSPVNYEDRALILGSDLSGENPETIKKFLLDTAKSKPHLIISSYTAKNLGIQLTYLYAKKSNIISDVDGVVMFGSNILGVDDNGAITYLQMKENEETLKFLTKEVENLKSLKAETEENKELEKPKGRNYNFNKK